LPVAQGFSDAVAQDRIAVVGVHCSVEQRASAGKASTGGEVGDVLLETVCVVGDRVEVVAALAGSVVPCVVEGFSGELFFAFEMAVDAAFFQARGIHDGLDRAALIAPLIEDWCGFGDDALAGRFTFGDFCGHTVLAACGDKRNRPVSYCNTSESCRTR